MAFVLFEEKALENSTEMVEATIAGDLDRVDSLLSQDFNPDAQDEFGFTALIVAAATGHLPLLERLLEAGASANVRDQDGFTPLMWAARSGHVDVARRLLQRDTGCDPDARAKSGATALIVAATENHVSMARLLLGAADADAQDAAGNSALMVALSLGARECARALLAAGASPDRRLRATGRTALHEAVDRRVLLDVEALLRHGADANARCLAGQTPLLTVLLPSRLEPLLARFRAARLGTAALAWGLRHAGHAALAERLEAWGGADWSAFLAAERARILEALVAAGADVDAQDAAGDNALTLAVKRGDRAALEVVLAHAPDATRADAAGDTALLWALKHDRATAERLLRADAGVIDVNGRGAGGQTPLTWALQRADETLVAWLLARGADLASTLGRDDLVTPAMQCVVLQHVEEVLVARLRSWTPPEVAVWLMWSGVASAEHRRRLTHARLDGAALLRLDAEALREEHLIVGAYREPILAAVAELRARMRAAALANAGEHHTQLVGELFWDKYVLDELLHANVWRAHAVDDPADAVAIKFCGSYTRLHREAALLDRLRSEFVVGVRELCEDPEGDAHGLVLELATCSLAQLLREPDRPRIARRKTLRRLAACAAFLAERGVVHGNLRARHVLAVGDVLKLCDFSAAADVGEGVPLPRGLPTPETAVALQQRDDVFVAAAAPMDLWGLGLVMFEVLSGGVQALPGPDADVARRLADPASFAADALVLPAGVAAGASEDDRKAQKILPTVRQLLSRAPSVRPSAEAVFASLGGTGSGASSPVAGSSARKSSAGALKLRAAVAAMSVRRPARPPAGLRAPAPVPPSGDALLIQQLRDELAAERAAAAEDRAKMMAMMERLSSSG